MAYIHISVSYFYSKYILFEIILLFDVLNNVIISLNWITACTEKFGPRPHFKSDMRLRHDALIPEIECSEWNIDSSWIAAAKSHASDRSRALS